MADRPTSVAKDVEGLHHEESALDRAKHLRDRFTHAQEQNNQKQQQQEQQQQRSGSQMVQQDRPAPAPTPNGAMRQTIDRQIAAQKLQQEHQRAGTSFEDRAKAFNPDRQQQQAKDKQAPSPEQEKARQEAAHKAMQAFHERQQQIRDHERDRER